jgi:integrase
LQKLRPAQIADWHKILLRSGGRNGRPLAAAGTVGHAHRVLHSALAHAARVETVSRNVASIIVPPKVDAGQVVSLINGQIAQVLAKLEKYAIYPIAVAAFGTGMRRGELCSLRWGAVDLDSATINVERSLEETNAGTRLKLPKSRQRLRQIVLPASVVDILRAHRVKQIELRLALGIGGPSPDDFVFCQVNGSPIPPDRLSQQWKRTAKAIGLHVTFHALRHTHASALIGAGFDVVTVSRRLGHSKASTTLNIYAHRFADTDTAAAQAMDAAMKKA